MCCRPILATLVSHKTMTPSVPQHATGTGSRNLALPTSRQPRKTQSRVKTNPGMLPTQKCGSMVCSFFVKAELARNQSHGRGTPFFGYICF